jgi:hypothetical protein
MLKEPQTETLTEPKTRFLGPSFDGFVFVLKSNDSSKANHTLTIKSQTSVDFIIASIQGTWQGDGPNAKPFGGSILRLKDLQISLTWANGMGGHNTLTGKLTKLPAINALEGNLWHLAGSVTAFNSDNEQVPGGPGNVAGNGAPGIPIVSLP